MNRNADCEKKLSSLEDRIDAVESEIDKLKDARDKGRFIGAILGSAITYFWDRLVNH